MSPKSKHANSPPPAHPWDKDYENAEFSPVYEPLWRLLAAFLGRVPVHTVLDFGCGDGAYACLMATTGLQVTGIDISATAITKAATRQLPGCTFIRHDAIPPDLPDHSFDALVMLNSLHCLDRGQRSALFNQARRVLKPGGHVFASVLSLEDESYPRQEWREVAPGTFVDETGKLFHFYSEPELAREFAWLDVQETKKLQNIHPACGKKSALFVVTAQYPGEHTATPT